MTESVDYQAFREEVREFAVKKCPDDIKAMVLQNKKLSREPWARWQKIVFDHGWGAPYWPKEYGGTGWDPVQRIIFDEVLAQSDCPPLYHQGLRYIGPVIMEFGTQEQKDRYLPPMLDGSEWWCQGYSEPDAGSDLASLKTKAERKGDVYVVNGQKTWTSHAHDADMMYALVRTSKGERKQQGISLVVIPMDSEGLTVRPIRTIDGWHHVNEVFLENVEVPVSNLIGEEGVGWGYGKFLLERERLSSTNPYPLLQYMERTRALINERLAGPENQRRRENLHLKLLRIDSEMIAQREIGLQAVDDVLNGRSLGLKTSALKTAGSKIFQRVSEISMEVLGPELAGRFHLDEYAENKADDISWLQQYLFLRARTIYGGSSEVQRNVIARQLFGNKP